MIGLNRPAACELGAIGVRVNAIAPWLFLTPMARDLGPKVLAALVAQVEAPRPLGDTRELARGCVFMIENASRTGEALWLDAATRLCAR